MSDNINSMDFRQLRNMVQALSDELAIMKRKYEDIIYNLDTDNFSSRFVKEQGDMRTAIKVTAERIETKVSNEEFQSALTQTAEKIETEVSALDKSVSSRISQTANAIGLRVQTVEGKTNSISVDDEQILIDGDKTAITGVIFLTNNDGEKRFEIFHDESQGYEQVFLTSFNGHLYGGQYINIGSAYDSIDFSNCKEIIWGTHMPEGTGGTVVAVFG